MRAPPPPRKRSPRGASGNAPLRGTVCLPSHFRDPMLTAHSTETKMTQSIISLITIFLVCTFARIATLAPSYYRQLLDPSSTRSGHEFHTPLRFFFPVGILTIIQRREQ
ncbi:hypothetical protein B0H11DRAFT_2257313 [Mycena galericulata]|nr:hypothetical protein B0H11DRAFT_2262780 [Mycena galericulata]KAJ7435356.1 hypothetical protein B0H11DRAFT_2257313 [Mycena galericulata]